MASSVLESIQKLAEQIHDPHLSGLRHEPCDSTVLNELKIVLIVPHEFVSSFMCVFVCLFAQLAHATKYILHSLVLLTFNIITGLDPGI